MHKTHEELVGENPRRRVLFIPVTDKTNDVVKFGPYDPMDVQIPPRPDIGGAFSENGSVPDDRTERTLLKATTINRRCCVFRDNSGRSVGTHDADLIRHVKLC